MRLAQNSTHVQRAFEMGKKKEVMKELEEPWYRYRGHVIEAAVKLTEHVNTRPHPRFDDILEAADKEAILELCDGDLLPCEVEAKRKEDPLRYLRRHVEEETQNITFLLHQWGDGIPQRIVEYLQNLKAHMEACLLDVNEHLGSADSTVYT